MNHYKVISGKNKTFTLIEDEKELGELQYKNWFTLKSRITLQNNLVYKVKTKGSWQSKVVVMDEQETVLIDFKLTWKGMVLNTYFNNEAKKYFLKYASFLKSKFELLDINDNKILQANCKFSMKSFNFNYDISTTEAFNEIDEKELLILSCIHCMNYYISFIAAV